MSLLDSPFIKIVSEEVFLSKKLSYIVLIIGVLTAIGMGWLRDLGSLVQKVPALVSNSVSPSGIPVQATDVWVPVVPARTPLPIITSTPQPDVGPYINWLAPDFSLTTIEGQAALLTNYRGQVVLLNFWTSWCIPCKEEMPAIQSIFENYQDQGFVVLGMNITALDEREEVERFVKELGLTFPILLDEDGKVSEKLYRVRSIPTSFFIDADGKVSSVQFGAMPKEKIEQTVKELLKDSNRQ